MRVDEPVVLRDAWNVLVHLKPAPVVARVSSGAATMDPQDIVRELAVAGHAARAGAPVAPPSDLLDPGPHEYRNLAGYSFKDVGFLDRPPFVFQPLLRTNFWNPHPVLSAVYGGLFYHHGAGSRPLELRSVSLRQYDHHIPRYSHFDTEHSLWLEISKNPVLYLNQLAQRG